MKKWTAILSVCSLVSVGVFAADYRIIQEHSRVSFVSIKKVDVAEVHQFKQIAGTLNEQGQFTLIIDLTTVDTQVAIRDERMKSLLFNVASFPQANLTAQINPKLIKELSIGATLTTQVSGVIDLHGQTQAKTFEVLVTKSSTGTLVVSSLAPVIIHAGDFGLTDGVNKLKEIAGLDSISLAVPVSFVLTLTQ